MAFNAFLQGLAAGQDFQMAPARNALAQMQVQQAKNVFQQQEAVKPYLGAIAQGDQGAFAKAAQIAGGVTPEMKAAADYSMGQGQFGIQQQQLGMAKEQQARQFGLQNIGLLQQMAYSLIREPDPAKAQQAYAQYRQYLAPFGLNLPEQMPSVSAITAFANTLEQAKNLDTLPASSLLGGGGQAQTQAVSGLPSDRVDLIKRFEGFSGTPYQDSGRLSIGYGTQGQSGQSMTQDEADMQLRAHLEAEVDPYLAKVKVPLNEGQQAALSSLIYNIGGPTFEKSTLLEKLNAGDYEGAAAEFGKYVKSDGQDNPTLVQRRAAEAQLFSGDGTSEAQRGEGQQTQAVQTDRLGRPLADGLLYGQGKSENQAAYNTLKAMGYSDKAALDLAEFTKVIRDPVSGKDMVVNIRTQEQVPIKKSAQEQQAYEALQNAESAPTLWNLAGETAGLRPWAKSMWTQIAPVVGLDEVFGGGWPETVTARQYVETAQQSLIRSLSNNARYPVAEQERIRKGIDIAPTLWDSETALRARMKGVDTFLRSELAANYQVANNDMQSPQVRQDALAAASNIERFLKTLGVPKDSGGSPNRAAKGQTTSPPPGDLAKPQTKEEYDALPSGTKYWNPTLNEIRVKP